MPEALEIDSGQHIELLLKMNIATNQLMNSMSIETVRSALEPLERLRMQINQLPSAQSFLDSYLEQERSQFNRIREIFSPSLRMAIDQVRQASREAGRVAALLEPSKAALDALGASRRIADEASRVVSPLHSILDQFKADKAVVAPWIAQMESAANQAKKFIDSWPEHDAHNHEVDWHALDQHLKEAKAAILQLPTQSATEGQLRAVGITRFEWVTLAFTILTLLLQLLSYVETREQGRLARKQAADSRHSEDGRLAEEKAFRERLIATIEALAEHTPGQGCLHIVGPRAVRVRSATSGGVYVGIAHPNQIVTITARKSRWVKVRFRDNIEAREVEGWILKHYLVREQKNDDRAFLGE